MANRPTMSKLQKELDSLKREQLAVNQRLNEHEQMIKQGQRREIIRLLQEKNTNKTNSKPRYTYSEIAEMMDCSSATVSNIAKEEGLSRQLKIVD